MIFRHFVSLFHLAEQHKPLATYCGAAIVVLGGTHAGLVLTRTTSGNPKGRAHADVLPESLTHRDALTPVPACVSEAQGTPGCRRAAYTIRVLSLIRDQPDVDPDDPWLDTQTSTDFVGEMESAKKYLQMFGLLEYHPTEPFWVRILLAPKPIANRAGKPYPPKQAEGEKL